MNIANNIEHWALIDGYDNYEVSSFGRVRNNNTNKIMPGFKCLIMSNSFKETTE